MPKPKPIVQRIINVRNQERNHRVEVSILSAQSVHRQCPSRPGHAGHNVGATGIIAIAQFDLVGTCKKSALTGKSLSAFIRPDSSRAIYWAKLVGSPTPAPPTWTLERVSYVGSPPIHLYRQLVSRHKGPAKVMSLITNALKHFDDALQDTLLLPDAHAASPLRCTRAQYLMLCGAALKLVRADQAVAIRATHVGIVTVVVLTVSAQPTAVVSDLSPSLRAWQTAPPRWLRSHRSPPRSHCGKAESFVRLR